jgi:hypothetical protein
MTVKVHVLKEHELPEEDVINHLVFNPSWSCVLWMEEKVHCKEAKDNPVVGTVFNDVGPGHCVIGESVHKQSLVLAFQIVNQSHRDSHFLHVKKRWIAAIDLFTEENQQQSYKNWSSILNQENCCPRNLHAQVFEEELDNLKVLPLNILAQLLCLIGQSSASRIFNCKSYSFRTESTFF